jgi:mannose-6-phosphate isomerase-like protein (cupin superfamily)
MNATFVRAGDGERLPWGPAGTIRILAGLHSTDGDFSVVEATEGPGSAAPLHVHHGEAEAFYVVDGEIELTCGDETMTASSGDFVYTPKDVPHKYAVVGERPARVLLFFSRPGFESFFVEGAAAPDPAAMHDVVAKYDLELLETFGH